MRVNLFHFNFGSTTNKGWGELAVVKVPKSKNTVF